MQRPLERRFNRYALSIGPAAVLGIFMMLAGRAGEDMPHMGLSAILTLLEAAPLALAWLLAAVGFGWPLRVWLAPKSDEPIALQIALGVAVMLWLDAGLGRLGLLQIGGSLGAWLIVIAGAALLVEQIRRHGFMQRLEFSAAAPHWILWSAAPAIAVMLLAATSAPGYLWDTEFGGYDALSYHLQLSKEWLAGGAIAPLEHNAYSFFPSAVEGAFYHLMVMRGDAVSAAYTCQLLHVIIGLTAAWIVGRIAARLSPSRPEFVAGVAAAVFFGTPWVAVTASLAYNEMAMLLMFAAGLLVLVERRPDFVRCGAMVGLFAGTACTAKLSAVGFVAAPLGLLLLISIPLRGWGRALPTVAIVGVFALAPHLITNAVATGNPVFPFGTSVLGAAHWTPEQAHAWSTGHHSDLHATGRAAEAWRQLLRFGIGPAPSGEERWHAQWSVLPWLTVAALTVLLTCRSSRRWGGRLLLIILVQVLFWIALTHIKSRFMLPMVVPSAVTIAFAATMFRSRRDECAHAGTARPLACVVTAVALLLWCAVPAMIFAQQSKGAPASAVGLAEFMTGDPLSPERRETLARADSPVIYINHLLPPGSRVLFIGEAAPFYYRGNFTYTTVWDRGPLSKIMRRNPDDPAAWVTALREMGYTHVLVHPVMLERWEQAGWNDPLLTGERIRKLAAELEREHQWPRGISLLRVP